MRMNRARCLWGDRLQLRAAVRLARKSPKTGKARSLREIAAELAKLGHRNGVGNEFSAMQVRRLLGKPDNPAADA